MACYSMNFTLEGGKGIVFPVTSDGDSEVGWNVVHPYFDIRHNQDGKVVSCTRRSHFTL